MLSIDRVRITTLGLLGLAGGGLTTPPPAVSDEMETADAFDRPERQGDLFSPGAPIFEAVETALRKAGYLGA